MIKKLKKIFFFSVTAPFYLEDSRRIQDSKKREWRSAWGGRKRERKRERECTCMNAGETVPEKALWLLLLYVFSSTWACPMQIGLSQECCLFCLKFSLWSSDLPCLLATDILDSFSLFYLPNIPPSRDGRPNSLGKKKYIYIFFFFQWYNNILFSKPPCPICRTVFPLLAKRKSIQLIMRDTLKASESRLQLRNFDYFLFMTRG